LDIAREPPVRFWCNFSR